MPAVVEPFPGVGPQKQNMVAGKAFLSVFLAASPMLFPLRSTCWAFLNASLFASASAPASPMLFPRA